MIICVFSFVGRNDKKMRGSQGSWESSVWRRSSQGSILKVREFYDKMFHRNHFVALGWRVKRNEKKRKKPIKFLGEPRNSLDDRLCVYGFQVSLVAKKIKKTAKKNLRWKCLWNYTKTITKNFWEAFASKHAIEFFFFNSWTSRRLSHV